MRIRDLLKHMQLVIAAMLLSAASVSMTACGDDDDLSSGGKGKMSGWVELDGKRYDFKYFYGGKNADGTEVVGNGFNVDPYKITNQNYNMIGFGAKFDSNGEWIPSYDKYDEFGYYFELYIDCNNANDDADQVFYSTLGESPEGFSAEFKKGVLRMDGKNITVHYSKPGVDSVSEDDPTTTINFHVEGTPQWVDFDDDYYE